jgi:hypothetical protein
LESALLATAETINLIQDDTESTLSATFHHVDNSSTLEEGEDDLAKTGATAGVRGIEFADAEATSLQDSIGESCLANAGWTDEKDGRAGSSLKPAADRSL